MKAVFAFLLLTSPLMAAELVVHRDLAYVEPKSERQTLDVYTTAGAEKRPIVFWIHGGGWQAGNKSQVDKKPQAFVDAGYVFVSTNYRLLPEATIAEMAGDVAKGIRWIRERAGEHGGDRDRLFVMGHSAGAQLAALVCTDDRYLKNEGVPLSVVKGCVPVDGDTYDVPRQIATVEDRRANIYRKKFGDEEQQKALSPVTHAAGGKSIPPVLILHVAGHPETTLQSNLLVDALKKAGVPAKAYPAEGKTHGTINSDLGQKDDPATRVMFQFVESRLKPEGAR